VASAGAPTGAVPTAEGAGVATVSSAKILLGEVKRHRLGVTLTLGAILLAAVAAFFYLNRRPALTAKDTILLADFVNTTGDTVFDGTLKQALAVQLEQSPFLNIFPDQRVREALRLMGRSADERVTEDVARDICQRQGLKAYLAGSISNLGSHLVMTLEAVNAHTGETLARQQVEAEGKEQVLTTLGKAATKLREKLGESLASIQKYDAPIEQATTSSLEALKAYSLGREQHYKGSYSEAIPLIKRATELDPNFARAYAGLSYSYGNLGQRQLAVEAMQKAFELRERTSEYEKLKITADYYWTVEHDVERAIEGLGLVTRTYPRDYTAHGNLSGRYNAVGRYEQAIEEGREAVRLNPNYEPVYAQLAVAFRCLNRFDEAKEIYEQALAQKLDTPSLHAGLYAIAFVRGDTAAMQQQLDWARGRPNEYVALFWQANTAAFLGQLRRARDLSQRGADAELSRNLKENAADRISGNAATAAAVGNCQQAREDAARASALPRTVFSFSRISIALALCGETGPAQSLADEYAKQYPKDTLINAIWLPAIRAAIEIRRHNPAQAIQFLQSATRYDRAGDYWPEYLRGQAYLAQGAGAEATAEFQKILERRGLAPTSVLYPLAHLGLARAAALTGDTAQSRKAYQDLFALWKDADADLPVLIEAKKEYEKVK
jgi:tetratricopeptide (TPR) repeat protein